MRTTWGVLKAHHHAAKAVARWQEALRSPLSSPSPALRQIINRPQAALHAATNLAEQL